MGWNCTDRSRNNDESDSADRGRRDEAAAISEQMGANDGRAMPATIAGETWQTVADITTTTKEDGERMINPTEQQLQRYWDRIQRALRVLQRAQRYDVHSQGDYYYGEDMVHSEHGDYVDISDVKAAIDILQGGQQ